MVYQIKLFIHKTFPENQLISCRITRVQFDYKFVGDSSELIKTGWQTIKS